MYQYHFITIISGLFCCALISTALLIPLVIRLARAVNAVDKGGYRKVFEGSMPLLGGLAIAGPIIIFHFFAAIAGYIIIKNWIWICVHNKDSFRLFLSFASLRFHCMTMAIGGLSIVVLGLIDDIYGLRARSKLLGQILVALFVCASGYVITDCTLPYIGRLNFDFVFGTIITMIWVVGLINAFNLIDGIDGLAAGSALVGSLALTTLGVFQENTYLTFASIALSGSLIAFLWYNFHPAKLFLGDTGSMYLGFTLSVLSLVGSHKSEAAMVTIAPMFALGFPIFETLISMLRRYMRGVSISSGDNLHTHHRLLRKGYSQPQVVLILCGTCFSLGAAAVISAIVPDGSKWIWCSYVSYLATLIIISWAAGYLQSVAFIDLKKRRQHNELFRALGKYAAIRINLGEETGQMDTVLYLCRQEMGLLYLGVRMHETDELLFSSGDSGYDIASSSIEKLIVKSSDGKGVLVEYTFTITPTEFLRQDIAHCMFTIFDQLKLSKATSVAKKDQQYFA